MLKFDKIFRKCAVIGMIHVRALPITPNYAGSVQQIIKTAKAEAEIYRNAGVDGVLIENMFDIPYVKAEFFTPETISVMTRVATEVKYVLSKNVKCGMQILAGGNFEALAVALAAELDFIRAEGFVFGHVADEGYMDSCAGKLLRYRRALGAEHIFVFTDIKKKHSSHAITSDVSLVETAHAAKFFQSDGLILTGCATGNAADMNQLQELKEQSDLPVLIGSGVDISNIENYLQADAFIIGSHFKQKGRWQNNLDPNRVQKFMEKIIKLR